MYFGSFGRAERASERLISSPTRGCRNRAHSPPPPHPSRRSKNERTRKNGTNKIFCLLCFTSDSIDFSIISLAFCAPHFFSLAVNVNRSARFFPLPRARRRPGGVGSARCRSTAKQRCMYSGYIMYTEPASERAHDDGKKEEKRGEDRNEW